MIKNLYQKKKPVISLEVFPPKEDTDISLIYNTLDKMKELSPDFISVTYGANGSSRHRTVEIAAYIQNTLGCEALAHLTCAALDEAVLLDYLSQLKKANVKNVLALRGDMPKDMTRAEFEGRHFRYAKNLIDAIPKHPLGSIGAACYPEIHPESLDQADDIAHLKKKVDAGADFLITQLFFDNFIFYDFMEQLERAGIKVPVSAGIMPITSISQIQRIVRLSGSQVPSSLAHILAKYQDNPEDVKKAGLEFASIQIDGLIQNNAAGIHLYTMNKFETADMVFRHIRP
ncbi:MAG: methylenetetrahydrofolate reductase [NAD(P)H] [Acetivibrio ethanolgignens]